MNKKMSPSGKWEDLRETIHFTEEEEK